MRRITFLAMKKVGKQMDIKNETLCPFCGMEIKDGADAVACPFCGKLHHKSCWDANKGCAVAGCQQRNTEEHSAKLTYCSKCGAKNQPGTLFCVKCGAPVESRFSAIPEQSALTAEQVTDSITSTVKANQSYSIKVAILGIINGFASVVLGIICFCLDTGRYVSRETYGGDAYTGIQNAAAATGSNVQSLAAIVKFGLGALLIVFGIALVCCFADRVLKTKKRGVSK